MTVSELVLEAWAITPLGKAARIAVAAGGIITATLVILIATMSNDGAWFLVLMGVALVATSVRAARYPTMVRLALVLVNVVAIPLIFQLM